jgi:hypothetical protein
VLRLRHALLLLTLACDAQPNEPPPPQVIELPPEPEPAPVVRPPLPVIAPGSDEPPAKPSTRAESEAAAPPWAKRGLDEIPLKERRALFEQLGDQPVEAGALAGAVLLCEMWVKGETDHPGLFAIADLTTVLTIGKNPRIEVRGEEDSSAVFVAIPQATLEPGDSIRAQVIDRDVFRDRTIGTVRGTYKGTLPWTGRAGRAVAECRALAGPALDKLLAERLAGADHWLTETAPYVAFDPEDTVDFGFTANRVDQTRTAVRRLAALVGWADPRVQRRLEWQRRIERPYVAAAKEFFAQALAATPSAGTLVPIVPMQFRGRVQEWTCDPDAVKRAVRSAIEHRRGFAKARGGCVLRLQIESTGSRPLRVDTFMTTIEGIAAPRLVLENGEVIPLATLAIEGHGGISDHTLAPGATGTVVAIPAMGHVTTGEVPPILVLTGAEDGKDRVWLRVP